jgi:CubicO group peptidase (beta-lactamase class C family)
LPGMTLALADRNGLIRSSQYGFADLKARVRVVPQTLFEIGSISKSFVALAILQLVEEGKLDLDKPVIEYLPWLQIESSFQPFTTHHLLSHTSGLSGMPLLMRVAATKLRVGFEPGTRWVYSNLGYDILGFLLETIDNRPFAESIQTRVLNRLDMKSSAPVITNSIRDRMAIGYGPLKPDRPFALKGQMGEAPWVEVPEAAGSIASTSGDMSKYLQMLLSRGAGAKGRVLSEATFALFTRPVMKSAFRGEDASYAYGLWVSNANNHTLLRHTGGMVAFSSAMYADMTEGFGGFASMNARISGGYRPVSVVKFALELLGAASNGQPLPPAPPSPPPPEKVTNASLYAGTFTSPEGKQLVLAAEGENLVLRLGSSRVVLESAGQDAFLVKHPEFELFLLTFGREKDVIVEVSHGSNWWTNERYSGPKTFDYPKEWDAYTGHYHSDNPWYGSARVVIRKGQLSVEGVLPLVQVDPGVFKPATDPGDADRIVFDRVTNGRAMRMDYSGIEFVRAFTP